MTKDFLSPALVVVVVEDSDEDFDTVEEVARDLHPAIELHRATTGEACLNLLRGVEGKSVRPDMVLMDLNIPGTDGREALAAIKSEDALKRLPVVVHTTSSNPIDLAFCYNAGANAYHVKPVRYAEHVQVLKDMFIYWMTRVVLPRPWGREP